MIYQYQNGIWISSSRSLPVEKNIILYLNGQKYIEFLCTPAELKELVLGFLYNINVIEAADDIREIEVSSDTVLVWLWRNDVSFEQIFQRTSGFGGITRRGKKSKHTNERYITFYPRQLFALNHYIQEQTKLYQETGGIHFSALCTEKEVILLSEDIGRHNTMDKIAGSALIQNISTEGKWLITSGRISLEMVQKASRMGVRLIASMTTPTLKAETYAREQKMVLVGRLKDEQMNLYR